MEKHGDRVAMEKNSCKVCVTGGAGFIGSSLVKKLLHKGYTVHATLRNLDDRSKVGLLKSFPEADKRLVLFEADIYDPDAFEHAIKGCEFVFHVATPLQHNKGSDQYRNITEAAIAGAKSIAMCCGRAGTVRRLIYTASVVSASPLKHDGSGFKDLMDETCWTPLNLSFAYCNDSLKDYTDSKTMAEKEILRYGDNNNGDGSLEVVSLPCGLVGGNTLLSSIPSSAAILISQLTNMANEQRTLNFLEELLGKIPVVHIDDVCEAHIFCMEKDSINGRFLCGSSYVSSPEIANHCRQHYPDQFHVMQEYLDRPERKIEWGSKKLIEKGFVYKCDLKMIIDESIESARRLGYL